MSSIANANPMSSIANASNPMNDMPMSSISNANPMSHIANPSNHMPRVATRVNKLK